jgi:hypothetical integral membrane protein (TIGR02206 family)
MTVSKKIFIGVGISSIVVMQVIFSILLMRPVGVRMRYPADGESLPLAASVAGDTWMKGGTESIEVHVVDSSGREVMSVPAQRDAVMDRGKTVTLLAAWRAAIEFPGAGTYSIAASAAGSDGRSIRTAPRTVTADPAVRPRAFVFGSLFHIVPIVLVALLTILVPLLVKRTGSDRARDRAALVISLVLWVDEIAYQIWWFLRGAWSTTGSLMLHLCGLAIIFLPVLYFTENAKFRQYLFEIMYFFGLGGAMQALFAPDIGLHGFPEPKFFCFFISHGTLVMGAVFAAVLYKVDLTWKSWIRIIVITNLCTWAAYGINMLLRFIPPYEVGNYFAIGYPPPNGSVIDVFAGIFGPAPRYLIGLELMGLAVFGVLYLPFPIRRLLRRRSGR